MNGLDPRLSDPALLRLAARLVLHRQTAPPDPPPEAEGLATLLAWHHRQRTPAARQDASEHATGLAGLLAEARQFVGQEPPA